MDNKEKFDLWYKQNEISESAYFYLNNGFYELKYNALFDSNYRISIAISTFKRSSLLVRLLDSIIAQEYDKEKIEIVIVDDCSNDETATVVNNYISSHQEVKIKFFINECNVGVGQSKKHAYLECSGDIIIFADDDDYFIDTSYFSLLNDTYLTNCDCTMTVAGTIVNYEKENVFELQKINFDLPITNKDYINGFVATYTKPNSMFTMSLKANSMRDISYDELLYFNDTPIYLFGLLAEGKVFPLNRAVGIYFVNGKNMTGNARLDYILGNLDAKHDIYCRAVSKGLLIAPHKWYYTNIGMTASYYLKGNQNVKSDDLQVWQWLKEHFTRLSYFRYVLSVIVYRLRRNLPVKLSFIKI